MKRIKTNKYQNPLFRFNNYKDYTKEEAAITLGQSTIAPSTRTTSNLEYGNVDKGISHQGRGFNMRLPILSGQLHRGRSSQLMGNLNLQSQVGSTPQNDKYTKKFVDSDMDIMNQYAPPHLQNVTSAYGAYQDMSAPSMTNVGTRYGLGLDYTTALGRRGSLGRGTALDIGLDAGLNYSRGEEHSEFLAPAYSPQQRGAVMGPQNSFAYPGSTGSIGWGGDIGMDIGLRNQRTGLSGQVSGSYGTQNTINPGLRVGGSANIPLFKAGPGKVNLTGGAGYDFTSGTPRYNAGLNYTFKNK